MKEWMNLAPEWEWRQLLLKTADWKNQFGWHLEILKSRWMHIFIAACCHWFSQSVIIATANIFIINIQSFKLNELRQIHDCTVNAGLVPSLHDNPAKYRYDPSAYVMLCLSSKKLTQQKLSQSHSITNARQTSNRSSIYFSQQQKSATSAFSIK